MLRGLCRDFLKWEDSIVERWTGLHYLVWFGGGGFLYYLDSKHSASGRLHLNLLSVNYHPNRPQSHPPIFLRSACSNQLDRLKNITQDLPYIHLSHPSIYFPSSPFSPIAKSLGRL